MNSEFWKQKVNILFYEIVLNNSLHFTDLNLLINMFMNHNDMFKV